MRASVLALALLFAALAPRRAHALGPVDVGVSAVVVGGYNALDRASPSSFMAGEKNTEYPGFGGFFPGAGLALDLRVLGLVGAEVSAFYSSDRGSGEVTQGTTKATVTIGQAAIHAPLLLKGVLPLPLVRPFLVAGPELVIPILSKAESDPPGAVRAVAGATRYTMFTAGVGGEMKLPLSALDLRASLSLRGSYRLGSSSDLSERVTALTSGATIFDSRWRYQATLAGAIGVFF